MLMQTETAGDETPECDSYVHIVSGDETLRGGLVNAVREAGFGAVTFESADTFLADSSSARRGCLVLDTESLELGDSVAYAMLIAAAATMPLVLIVRQTGIPASVRALKALAVDFLITPVEDRALVESVALACKQGTRRSEAEVRLAATRIRYASLTLRQKQVLALVTEGLMNKQVAARLGLTVITVKVHRATMMKKMRCRRLVELVRAADTLTVEAQLPDTMQQRGYSSPLVTDSPRAAAH
jgi:FixJ family two-component response regulator